jgi:hypothetical protein
VTVRDQKIVQTPNIYVASWSVRISGYISDSRVNDGFYRKFTSQADIWVRLSSLDNGGELESQAKGDRNLSPKIALTKMSEAARMGGILSSFVYTFVFIRFAFLIIALCHKLYNGQNMWASPGEFGLLNR